MVHNEIISSHGKTSGFFQPKYAINAPNDMYEQEADAVAEKVIQSKQIDLGETFFKPVTISSIQRKCEHCEQEEKEKLHRKEENGNESETSPSFDQYVDGLNNSGSSLPPASKTFFESRMGYDFSNVKIHTDSVATKSAQSIHALAYTSGNNIVFNQNQFQPGTTNGDKLIAHELTHVVQQKSGLKRIARVSQRQTTCRNTPINFTGPPPLTIADPLTELTTAVDRAVEIMTLAIDDLQFTRTNILAGAPAAVPTFGDELSRAIAILGFTAEDPTFWTGTTGAAVLIRRLSMIRDSIGAGGGMFYICQGPQTGTIGACVGSICQNANAASCPGSFRINFCRGFWEQGNEMRAQTIIHEASHNFADFIGHSARSRTAHATCYARFCQIAAGVDTAFQRIDLCPDP